MKLWSTVKADFRKNKHLHCKLVGMTYFSCVIGLTILANIQSGICTAVSHDRQHHVTEAHVYYEWSHDRF